MPQTVGKFLAEAVGGAEDEAVAMRQTAAVAAGLYIVIVTNLVLAFVSVKTVP